MSDAPSQQSTPLLTAATEHPELSIPLFAGAGALIAAVGIGRHLVGELISYRGLPPRGDLFPALYFLFVCCVLLACSLALRRLIVRNGWPSTLGLISRIYSELPRFDRVTVWLIAFAVFAFLVALLVP